MFEYLKFNVGGYFYGFRKIEITNNAGELEIYFKDQFSTLAVETSSPDDGWTDKLRALKLENWKDSYDDLLVCDGTQWELDYKFSGSELRHIYGSNDYPEDWMKLIDLLEEFHPEIDFLCHDDENGEDIDLD